MMQVVHSTQAPAAVGPYSQAIKVGNTVYLAGQIPLDPNTMQLCSAEVDLQITQVIKNLAVVCEAAGGSLTNIVKLSVYLTNLSHVPLVNEAMIHYFAAPYPARTTIEVSALPRGAQVEMDAIMCLPS